MEKKWEIKLKAERLEEELRAADRRVTIALDLAAAAETIAGQRDALATLQRETDLALLAEKAKWQAATARLRAHLLEPQVMVAHKITDTERAIAIMECIAIVEECAAHK